MKEYEKLLEQAFAAMEHAYAPYSNFQVGACIETTEGVYIQGVNVENAAYGSTMCAERNAVYSAYSQGYRKADMKALAIVSQGKELSSPCGACRQVLGELLDPHTPIILSNKEQTMITNMEELLPMAFLGNSLKK